MTDWPAFAGVLEALADVHQRKEALRARGTQRPRPCSSF
jgi:hypothetical protein